MKQENMASDEIEIDLRYCFRLVVKRWETFIAVFLSVILIGGLYLLSVPGIYRITMTITPPVFARPTAGSSDLESAKKLGVMISNGFFDDGLKKKMGMSPETALPDFVIRLPNKAEILQVGVDCVAKDRVSGIALLKNLAGIISEDYAARIEFEIGEVNRQIKQHENFIDGLREKSEYLQSQAEMTTEREKKLDEERKTLSVELTQILNRREELSGSNPSGSAAPFEKDLYALLVACYLQNNSIYLNVVDDRFRELARRRSEIASALKDVNSQISSRETEIDKLKASIGFISRLKVVAGPRASSKPLSPNKKKIMVFFTFLGAFSGVCAVFLGEYWANKRR